ncbi:MAG: OmpH family outer membrane protein [Blastocatellia bacterium]|nr:OmpH family outer membrane protein [Blastocatellia bacterium]
MIQHSSSSNRREQYASLWAVLFNHFFELVKNIAVSLLVLILFSFSSQAQTSVFVFDSRIFATDINEYREKVEQLNNEFQTQAREVQRLGTELRNFEVDLNTNRLNYTESILRDRTERVESLRKQYKRKSEDLEVAIKKRAEELVNPIKDKILQVLKEYSQANNITLLYDMSKAVEKSGIVYVSKKIDITEDFVQYYNQKPRR